MIEDGKKSSNNLFFSGFRTKFEFNYAIEELSEIMSSFQYGWKKIWN